jgi:chemotaxis protein CheD
MNGLRILIQGEHGVADHPDSVLATVLGSCIAACLRDPVAGIGGMNHFLLPEGSDTGPGAVKYGLHAMELLINSLIRAGASRTRLEAKLFGGSRMMRGLPDIGTANARFATEFLRREGIADLGGSLGGDRGRKIRYWPVTGRVQMQLLDPALVQERPFAPPPKSQIDLF